AHYSKLQCSIHETTVSESREKTRSVKGKIDFNVLPF
ncbi:MAG: hypothetical protein ACI9FU_001559, partial [Granulosicoccus sp.]